MEQEGGEGGGVVAVGGVEVEEGGCGAVNGCVRDGWEI